MNDALLILREVILLIHLIGFALLLGGWAVQAFSRGLALTMPTRIGLGIMIVSGLILAIPFPAGVGLDYLKLGIKLLIALGIGGVFGVIVTREKAGKSSSAALFWSVGVLTVLNAGIALIWH